MEDGGSGGEADGSAPSVDATDPGSGGWGDSGDATDVAFPESSSAFGEEPWMPTLDATGRERDLRQRATAPALKLGANRRRWPSRVEASRPVLTEAEMQEEAIARRELEREIAILRGSERRIWPWALIATAVLGVAAFVVAMAMR